MPIELITGLPGNGKTAIMMERLKAAAEKADRPITICGVDGVQPGLGTVLEDPKRWNDVDADGKHLVPDGSLVFVDEAWKWFGHLQDAGRQATPPHVLALAEHRHRGIDFVWTTQQPSQIYPFARGLIATHYHVVRRFGSQFLDVFKWQELCDDVKSVARRENAEKTTRTLPKASFGMYKSASEHTIKARIPVKVWALPVLFLAGAALLYLAYSMLRPDAMAASLTNQEPNAAPAASALTADTRASASGQPKYVTPEDYARAHTARIATIPGSAPVFDARRVTADPQLFCMASDGGDDANGKHLGGSCSCVTEQGTPYGLTDAECRMVARNGAPYNPYKQPSRAADNRSARPEAREVGAAHGDALTPGAIMTAPQISAYGDTAIPSDT